MTKNVVSATQHIDELSRDYAIKEIEINKQLEEIQQKSQQLIQQAQDESQSLKVQAIKEAAEEKEKILNQARAKNDEIIQQAENSRQLILSEMDERIGKEAINKACELIQNTLPEQFKQDVHTHWVEELIKDGFSNLARLNIPPDICEVKVTSAFPLSEEIRQDLFKKIKNIFGRDIKLKEEVDRKIVAGLIISVGSLVLDGSLKNKIQEQAKGA
jgi:F0F1-type ATP synthase delta subunit